MIQIKGEDDLSFGMLIRVSLLRRIECFRSFWQKLIRWQEVCIEEVKR